MAVRGILREEGDLERVGFHVEARGEVLGDELDVVPAEPGGVDLGAEDGREATLVEPRVDAGGLPVDDGVARCRFARCAAQARGQRAGDGLYPCPGAQSVRLV